MNDGEVRSGILRVLGGASTPLKALDIARRIGNGCDKKAVNRVLYGPCNSLKESGEVELATPPGQNPPLWRISRTGSSQPAAGAPNQSGAVAPTLSPPSGGVALTHSSTSPDPLQSETLYKKREEGGAYTFTPVSGEHPPSSGQASSGSHAQTATSAQANSGNVNLDYIPNTISTEGASPLASGQKHQVNRFTSSAKKDYQKDDPKKQEAVLSRKLNNSEQPPANVAQGQSPGDVEKQLLRTINNSQLPHVQVAEPHLTQSAQPDSAPNSKSKKKKKSAVKLAAKFDNSSQPPPSDVEALSRGVQSLQTHKTPTTTAASSSSSSTSLRESLLHILKGKGEMKEEEIKRLAGGGAKVSKCLAGLLQEGKVEKREDRTGVYWRATAP